MYREEQLKALFEGKKILVAGYGREGRSTERIIKTLLPEADISIADGSDCIAKESADESFDMIIKSPGVPMMIMNSNPAKVTSQVDLFMQVYADKVIGITGTKGKSTTTSLIHHLLPGSILAGNIGIPLFDILESMKDDSLVVAELSCHQLEVLHRSPHIAVVLNLFQEHLDHYKDYMGYKMAKMQIALHQNSDDHFFYCTDNQELCDLVENGNLKFEGCVHPYTINSTTEEERRLLEVCPLEGEHNRSNALVACRVASLFSHHDIITFRTQLSKFQGLRHRLECVGTYRGIIFYNDSISTIPQATVAALKALPDVETLILGGFDRGIDYSLIISLLASPPEGLHNVAFVGEVGRRILDTMNRDHYGISSGMNILQDDDYNNIVRWCYEVTSPGKICLLSPAAASYDSFKNFEERGDTFIKLVKQYA